jgi:hypothetical protein
MHLLKACKARYKSDVKMTERKMINMHLLEACKVVLNVTYYLTEIRDKVRQEKGRKKAREGHER